MLRSAPKFYEVAKRIVEITEDCILVAHNAQFDYRILTTEFRRLGFDFERENLCTDMRMLQKQKEESKILDVDIALEARR
jgi:DNA polymerase III epsilon subunit-like protein